MNAAPREYVVIGGGCFGSFYVRQLLKWADRRGGPVDRITVVDRNPACRVRHEIDDARVRVTRRDWTAYLIDTLPDRLDRHRDGQATDDRIVPSPLAPHIFLHAFAELTGSRVAAPATAKTALAALQAPFRLDLDTGSVALSHATWVCPVNCIEPARCPETRGPLHWNMTDTVTRGAGTATHVLACLHEAFGVGTIRVHDVVVALARLQEARDATTDGRAVVATVSTCHGVAGLLEFGNRDV